MSNRVVVDTWGPLVRGLHLQAHTCKCFYIHVHHVYANSISYKSFPFAFFICSLCSLTCCRMLRWSCSFWWACVTHRPQLVNRPPGDEHLAASEIFIPPHIMSFHVRTSISVRSIYKSRTVKNVSWVAVEFPLAWCEQQRTWEGSGFSGCESS